MAKEQKSLKETTLSPAIPSEYTTLATKLKRGKEVLGAISHINRDIFNDPIVSMGAKRVTASLVDLMTLLSNRSGQDVASLGTFINDTFRKYMEGRLNNEQVERVLRIVDVYLETYTPGMSTALSKIKYKGTCRSCGFQIPSYPGSYPKFCPNCGSPLNMSSIKIESLDKVCSKCGKIHDSVFDVCEDCGSNLYLLSDELLEVYSAILEVYYLVKSTPDEGEPVYSVEDMYKMLSESNLSVRRKNLIQESKGNEGLLAEILRRSMKSSGMEYKTLDLESTVKFLSGLDKCSLATLFPFVLEMDKNGLDGIFKGLYTDILDKIYEVRSAVNVILNNESLFSSDSYEDLNLFLESLYGGLIHNIASIKDSSFYSNLAIESIGLDHLGNIRKEVKRRKSLASALSSLGENDLNIDTALKSYSSCLTRIVIEGELSNDASLRAFKKTVIENLQNIFKGRYEESVNFIKGVFLGG